MKKEKIKLYLDKESERDLHKDEHERIKSFFERDIDNEDTKKSIMVDRKGEELIFVKFAGTGCYLPRKILEKALKERHKEVKEKIKEVEDEMNKL